MKQDTLKVILIDTKENNPNHYICRCIYSALQRSQKVSHVKLANLQDVISEAQREPYDLLLAFDGEELDRELCARLCHLVKISALWVTEDPYEINVNKINARLFDLVYTNNSDSVKEYGDNARHLPFAADSKIHFHECSEHKQYLYDLFFVGTAWPNRVNFLAKLIQGLPSIRYKIGLPYNQHLPKPCIGISDSSLLWKTPNSEFCRMSSLSKFTLTLHRDFSSSGDQSIASTPGPRLFEIGMAGGTQLIDMNLPEVTKYYNPDEQFLGFNSIDECINLIGKYIDQKDELLRISRSAQIQTLNFHTYESRIDIILNDALNSLSIDKAVNVDTRKEKNILFVVHNYELIPPYGGIEVFIRKLINNLDSIYKTYILVPTADKLSAILINSSGKEINRWNYDFPIDSVMRGDHKRCSDFLWILNKYNIDIVHFHHILHHPIQLLELSKKYGVSVVFNAHDYYLICDSINLIDFKGKHCYIKKEDYRKCMICNNSERNTTLDYAIERKNYIKRYLPYIDIIQYNHLEVKKIFENNFPELIGKDIIIPIEDSTAFRGKKKSYNNRELNIAFVGNFIRSKGADTFIFMVNMMRSYDINFYILGNISDQYKELFNILKIPNLNIYGAYTSSDLESIIDRFNIDLSLHISIWPETYCISLSECMNCGVVPIVTDIGAHGARIIDGLNGYKINVDDPNELIKKIIKIYHNPDLLNDLQSNIINSIGKNNTYNLYNEIYDNVGSDFLGYKKDQTFEVINAYPQSFAIPSEHNIGPSISLTNVNQLLMNISTLPRYKMAFYFYKKYGFKATLKRVKYELFK